MTDTAVPDRPALAITKSAARRVSALMAAEDNPDLMLRIAVSGGGCSGFKYEFDLDTVAGDEDKVFDAHGIKVVVDETSLDLLAGSELDYVEDLMAAAFQIRNPQATATCGCGTSFSL